MISSALWSITPTVGRGGSEGSPLGVAKKVPQGLDKRVSLGVASCRNRNKNTGKEQEHRFMFLEKADFLGRGRGAVWMWRGRA